MTDTILIAFLFSLAAGLSTGLGSLVAFFIKDFKHRHLSLLMGFSAGVLIQISFMELLFSAVTETGFLNANIAFFLGIAAIAAIEFLIPHEYEEEKLTEKEKKNKRLMKTGMLVSAGIVIHNFPEGIITLFGTLKDPHLGLVLLIAIALHNIPEGISVSIPIYYATKNRKKAFIWSLLSGLSEPIGALIGFFVLFPFITPFVLNLALAFVAGIMVFISFDELLPLSLSHGEAHVAITSLFLGMLTMTAVLFLLG
ncbi:zinc transporter ZupT [Candidatus Bathyarchaeota archaeon]|nr:zinc transporter ZupT [Candidatus Bathyarchaeota archaeon]